MPRYRFTIAYKGSAYHGWQRQPNAPSVQAEVERALGIVLRQPVEVTGSGRTDAGVHAMGQVAHFDLATPVGDLVLLERQINGLTPPDIAVCDLRATVEGFHARFDAIERTYQYFIHYGKSPMMKGLSAYTPKELDIHAMNEAAAYFVGEHSFRSFAKTAPEESHYRCRVDEASWQEPSVWRVSLPYAPDLCFRITANRFLRGMVRALVGAMLKVGAGEWPPERMKEILEAESDQLSAPLAKPEGLYLWEVGYEGK